jgi:hypothetical protein
MNANFPYQNPAIDLTDFAPVTPDKSRLIAGFCFGGIMSTRQQQNQRSKAWRERNPEWSKRCHKNWQLKFLYGISVNQYDALVKKQNGKCAICGRPPHGERRNQIFLNVDHDHTTGNIRGLLCNSCNLVLGNIDDNQEWLRNAIDYLNREPEIIIPKMELLF